jgi:ATP-dependent DNA helicase RecQ
VGFTGDVAAWASYSAYVVTQLLDCSLPAHLPHQQLAEARATLSRVWGYDAFREGQEEVLKALLEGRDVLAVMPTGSGKSICYQLPALLRTGLTVVISPLIALMQDQVQQLRALGIAAGALNSGNAPGENLRVERAIDEQRLRLVYVAPERFALPGLIDLLRRGGASLLAVDEAHCISQWGHDFRPEYLALRDLRAELGNIQTIAVTATADAPTREEIIGKLFTEPPQIFVRSFDRPNLFLAMARKKNAPQQIARFVEAHRGESGIIYCNSRKRTEKFAQELSSLGHRAIAYHAGLDVSLRNTHQAEFIEADGVIMVATIAFGMGIDKPDVRFVCHADLPGSLEAYYQEIGRAGRDGLPADTLSLWGEEDVALRRKQIEDADLPRRRRQVEHAKLDALLAFAETPRCRRQTLLKAFGEDAPVCHNCDNCKEAGRYFNARTEAQMAMSAILRTSGRFVTRHFINILTGETTEAVKRHTHQKLKTFGVGKDRSAEEWRSIFRQLQATDLIGHDIDDDGRWYVTEQGRRVLTGEADIQLRDPKEPRARPERIQVTNATSSLSTAQQSLFAALKAKRLEIARREHVPAYVIFNDRSLIEMAERRPTTLQALSEIHGLGEHKLAHYGAEFLAVIKSHAR